MRHSGGATDVGENGLGFKECRQGAAAKKNLWIVT
jgi:hypothetical protein